jgi:16S rRNA (adenine1518-N6/adenine1519-N6)-dimethyltransferase
MKLSEIQSELKALSLRPSKNLGQNFLHDQNLALWIVDQLELGADDHLVEIGPGLGALTAVALSRCRSATLLEKDRRLTSFLVERFARENVDIRNVDATTFDLKTLFPKTPVKVLGNLPYYVTSPILFRFTRDPSPVSRLVFTMQRELAERLAASPRSKAYGALTLILGRRWRIQNLRTLPGSVFVPVPQVESAVVLLTPRCADELLECDGEYFDRLVKQGFSQRRKQLKNLLRVDRWPEIASELKVADTARAEELTLEQWIQLTNLLRPVEGSAQEIHREIFDVVDEADRVIGRNSRHEIHAGKFRHRAVHIFVFNGAGELFLQKRSRWKDVHPGKWDSSAAGHVDSGDDYDATATRELQEELGVIAALKPVAKIEASEATGWEFVRLYETRHDGPFELARSEIETGAYFSPTLIDEWIRSRPQNFATGFMTCWRVYRSSRA